MTATAKPDGAIFRFQSCRVQLQQQQPPINTMRAPASFLHRTVAAVATDGTSSSPAPPSPPEQRQGQPTAPAGMAVDSNMVVILASLLCAIVCVLGLALVSRCACRRRRSASSSPDHSSPPPKGLKKKVIEALPTVSFTASSSSPAATTAWSSSSECAICLADFVEGEAVRVLPRCGHGFHVACVDAWLRTHATCPSCRAAIIAEEPVKQGPTVVVVVAGGCSRCTRCGEVAAPACAGDATPAFMP
uniref:Uncharacterized protein n=1 Tax=Avena sativa TaxID=4498 RepID=A0ACD6AMP1_AVESA